MKKTFLWMVAGISLVTFFVEAPPAHAIFGIRAARTALAARKARQIASSDSASLTSEEAYTREKARFNRPVGPQKEERGPKGAVA